MIKEVSGDILLSKADAIAHGVAPGDHFNQGLAMSLRERWPAMFKDFRHYCHQSHPKTGELWTWSGVGGTHIVNLFTQEAAYDKGSKPGKASLDHVAHALKALKKEAEKNSYKSIAITRLGTGVGGLDWDEVRPLIDQYLGELKIPVYVYGEYKPGIEAAEAC